jgi:hypothetical protein
MLRELCDGFRSEPKRSGLLLEPLPSTRAPPKEGGREIAARRAPEPPWTASPPVKARHDVRAANGKVVDIKALIA